MKTSLKAIAGIAVLSSLATFGSQAQSLDTPWQDDAGIYVGANYGYLSIDGDGDFDDDDDVIQGIVGYRFNRYIALEGSYIDFGSYGTGLANAETDGYTAAIKGTLPLSNRWALFAKTGQLWRDTNYSVAGINGDTDDESWFIGAGVSYSVTKNFLINAEYTVYDNDLDGEELVDNFSDTDFDMDLRQASLGVEYRF